MFLHTNKTLHIKKFLFPTDIECHTYKYACKKDMLNAEKVTDASNE